MRRRLVECVAVVSLLGGGFSYADDLSSLGLPTDSGEYSGDDPFMEGESDIDRFRRKFSNVRRWVATAPDMDNDRLKKIYNSRVSSLSDLLMTIESKIKKSTQKELATLGLKKDADLLERMFKAQGFKKKREKEAEVQVDAKDSPTISQNTKKNDKSRGRLITTKEIEAFKAKTAKQGDEIAVYFIINEKLDLLEKLGYPEIKKESIDPMERFIEIFNAFFRRDLYVLIDHKSNSDLLDDDLKRRVSLLDYYGDELEKLKKKGEIRSEIEFSRIGTDVKGIYANVTRNSIDLKTLQEYKFYVECINDILVDEQHIDDVPEINMKAIKFYEKK